MNVTEKTKIGMCCQCGGIFSKKDTVIVDGFEVCRECMADAEEE